MITLTRNGIYNFKDIFAGTSTYEYSLEEIYSNLDSICRYNGNCSYFYPVSIHSVLTSKLYEKDPLISLYNLMHDFHEAYTGDITTPIQEVMRSSNLKVLQKLIDIDIRKFFSIPEPTYLQQQMIYKCDRLAFIIEFHNLYSEENIAKVKSITLEPMSEYALYLKKKEYFDDLFFDVTETIPYKGKEYFINRFLELKEKVK